jgi:hypothetical protein
MLPRPLALACVLAVPLYGQAPTITDPAVVRTRAVWFVESQNPIGAEVGFAHAAAPANEAIAKVWTDAKPGTRIALGTASWAALETFTELKFGSVAVKAGNYYCVLERGKDAWTLGLLDPEKVRGAQLPPGIAKGQPLVAALPLAASESTDNGLQAAWEAGAQADAIALVLGVGAHTLRANATVKGAGSKAPAVFPDERGGSRVTFGPADAAKVPFAVVDHGVVAWNAERASAAKAMPIGNRWRLGKDWATTFDSNAPLTLGGKKVAAGSWHLTLAKTKDGWNLVLSPAEADHKAKVDGFGADFVHAALEVPVQRSTASTASEKLRIAFEENGGKLELAITFGSERLAVALAPGKS